MFIFLYCYCDPRVEDTNCVSKKSRREIKVFKYWLDEILLLLYNKCGNDEQTMSFIKNLHF